MVGQGEDVVLAFAQWRRRDLEDVYTVVEVFSESASAALLCQVAVGRSDQSDIDPDGFVAAHRAKLSFLQDTEQLDLHRQGNFPDFIKKNSSTVGQLEQPFLVGYGPGKGASDMAEKLTLQQGFRQCRAVLGDERPIFQGPVVMDDLGDEFLAGTCFSLNQHGGWDVDYFLHKPEQPAHRGARADDFLEAGFGLHLGEQGLFLAFERLQMIGQLTI